MIQPFVDRFIANEQAVKAKLAEAHIDEYKDIVKLAVETISDDSTYSDPDPERIHEIDDGSYQGMLVYVIGAKGYQPSDYWTLALHVVQGLTVMQGEPA